MSPANHVTLKMQETGHCTQWKTQNILTLYVLIDSNLLSVHVDSAFSVPDSWQIQMAQQFNYTASLPVPVSNEVRSSLDINSEMLKMQDGVIFKVTKNTKCTFLNIDDGEN